MGRPKKNTATAVAVAEVDEDTKHTKLNPKDWEEAEEEPELANEPGQRETPKEKESADPSSDELDDVIIIPEPPKDSQVRGPRDAIWSCDNKHETRGLETIKPECRFSTCSKPKTMRLSIVYEERQRRAKDPKKGA